MQGFAVRDGALHAEGVPLARLAREVGTPTYVYSAGVLRDRYAKLDAALAGAPHRIHYSCKANGSRGILEVLRAAGSGIDVVSGGELFKALRAGFAPEDILFGGVGLLSYTSGWRMHVDEKQALVAAQGAVGFAIGHASAQQVWRGLRSRPTWRVLVYSAENPPRQRGLVLVDAVDGNVIEHLAEINPEDDWSE